MDREATASKHQSPGTLGSLLYADPGHHRVPESEWVDLVGAVAAGDQAALRSLYDRTHRLVFTLALRITANRETAEEVTVDAFMGVWQRAGTYKPEAGTVIAWIMNLARSRTIDRVRYEQRSKRTSASGVHPADDPVVLDDIARELDLGTASQTLKLALADLPALERQVLEAAFFCDLSYAEVAEQFGQPLGTVKTRIRSGLARLRKAFRREGPP